MHVINFISPTAHIAECVSIWHFAVILDGVSIGPNVSIGSGTEIGRNSSIGAGTRIGAHVFLPPDSSVGRNCFIGPGVVCTDDKFPRANNAAYHAQPPVIDDGASIGAGAVILPGIHIGSGALIGAGAVVTHDVPADSTVTGVPARSYARRALATA